MVYLFYFIIRADTNSVAEIEHLERELEQKEKDYMVLIHKLDECENENKELRGMNLKRIKKSFKSNIVFINKKIKIHK
jgi:predicted RNase H-like nuclease (RuvC/YqgF family)